MATSNRWISPTKSHGWELGFNQPKIRQQQNQIFAAAKTSGLSTLSEGDTCGGATECADESERSWHRLSIPFPEMQQQRRCQVQLVMASNLWTLGTICALLRTQPLVS